MFEHALVALDAVPAGDLLAQCAPELSALGTEKLTLLHVASVDYPIAGAVAHLDEYGERLEALAGDLRSRGFDVTTVVRRGSPAHEIIRGAHDVGASLIFLGSRSRGLLKGTFIGSVTLGVLDECTLPVLFLRIEPDGGRRGAPLVPLCGPMDGPLVLATDFSRAAESATRVAATLARESPGRPVTLLHANGADGQERLDVLAAKLRAEGVSEVDTSLVEREPSTAILASVDQGGPLLVMGTRGMSRIRRLALGSVSRAVLGAVRVPVLLVPEDA